MSSTFVQFCATNHTTQHFRALQRLRSRPAGRREWLGPSRARTRRAGSRATRAPSDSDPRASGPAPAQPGCPGSCAAGQLRHPGVRAGPQPTGVGGWFGHPGVRSRSPGQRLARCPGIRAGSARMSLMLRRSRIRERRARTAPAVPYHLLDKLIFEFLIFASGKSGFLFFTNSQIPSDLDPRGKVWRPACHWCGETRSRQNPSRL